MGRSRNNQNNNRPRHKNNQGNQTAHPRGKSVAIVVSDTYEFEGVAQYFNHWAVKTEGRYEWSADREHLRIVVPSDWITNASKKEVARLGGSLGDR